MPGQHPPSQRQQNEEADGRLQEETRVEHAPLSINGTMVKRVSSFRCLRVQINDDLTWTHHTDFIRKFSRQRLFFLRRMRRLNMDSRFLCNFYRCIIESILTGCITTWYGSCTAMNRKALQRLVKSAQHNTSMELPSMEDLCTLLPTPQEGQPDH